MDGYTTKIKTTNVQLVKYLFIFLFLIGNTIYSQITFTELHNKMEEEPRYIVLNIYSDHCVYCAIQEKQIEKNKEIQEILKNHYYFVTLKAESDESILFNGKEYKKSLEQGIHELAIKYAEKQGLILYPSWIIFDENYNIVFQYQGLINSKNLIRILK